MDEGAHVFRTGDSLVKAIELKTVSLTLGNTPILDEVNWSVTSGQIIALTGPSGSGKSTLLRTISGITLPDRGEVWVGGVRVDTLAQETRATFRLKHMGLVFQTLELVDEINAIENVALPLRLLGYDKRSAETQSMQILKDMGVSDLELQLPGQLSGGQCQRIAISRSLVTQSPILLADEPTASLNRDLVKETMDFLVDRVRQQDSTLILATHDPTVAEYADKTYDLSTGGLTPQTSSIH